MMYRFPHPDDATIRFTYNEEQPQFVLRENREGKRLIKLSRKNINAEEFFLCLIKAKCIHIEDRHQGFAILDGKRFNLYKPYDCKSTIHALLQVRNENPLIVSDRREKCYLWPFSDEEMVLPEDAASGHAFHFDPALVRSFEARKRAFEDRFRVLEDTFGNARSSVQGQFEEVRSDEEQGTAVPPALKAHRRQQQKKAASFEARRKSIAEELSRVTGDMVEFPSEATVEDIRAKSAQFAEKKRGDND